MLGHYVHLALRALGRSPLMAVAVVVALALGVGASIAMLTVVRVMSWDPLPGLSQHLYRPVVDPLPASFKIRPGADPRIAMTWVDAKALLDDGPAAAQVALATGRVVLPPQTPLDQPAYVDGQFATSQVFRVFGIRFLEGAGWSAAEEAGHAAVIVISESFARRLRAGGSVVGRRIRLSEHSFTITGVIADWTPVPRFHTDMQREVFAGRDDFFIPLETAIALDMEVRNAVFSWGDVTNSRDMKSASATWLQFWVELEGAQARAAYAAFLQNHVQAQLDLGRFQRPQQAALVPLRDHLRQRGVVPAEVRLQLWLAIGFLFVCMVNICALLYARLSRRTHEIAVRRALGARRADVVLQLATEAVLVGGLGGVGALAVAALGLRFLRTQPEGYAALAVMDWPMAVLTPLLACVCSLLAAALPALRVASTRIAMQIKVAE